MKWKRRRRRGRGREEEERSGLGEPHVAGKEKGRKKKPKGMRGCCVVVF